MPFLPKQRLMERSNDKIIAEIGKLNSSHERLSETCERLEQSISLLNELIMGNGDPSKGLIVRFDRMENRERRRDIWFKAAIGGAVAAAFSFFGMLIKSVSK